MEPLDEWLHQKSLVIGDNPDAERDRNMDAALDLIEAMIRRALEESAGMEIPPWLR